MAEQAKALQVVNLQDAAMVPLTAPEIKAYLGRLLVGSPLSPDDLLMDMAQQMTINPKLMECTPQSLYATLIFTAKHHLTFGPGGVWPVPFGDQDEEGRSKPGPKVCTPQLDYRAMQKIAKDRHGIIFPLMIEFVYPEEHYREIRSAGKIVEIEHTVDRSRDRTKPDFISAYAVAEHTDGRRTILCYGRQEMDKRRAVSRAKSPRAPWTQWTMRMYRKTVIRMAEAELVPDFAAGMGSGGGVYDPEESGEPRDITAEANAASQRPALTQSQKLVEDLAPKAPTTGKPQEAAKPSSPVIQGTAGGYTDAQMATMKEQIADQALKGEKHLVNWCAQKYPAWMQTGGKDQAAELIKERDILIRQIRDSG